MTAPAEPRNLERDRTRRALANWDRGGEARDMAAAVQSALGYVPEAAIERVAVHAGVSPDAVRSIVESDAVLRLTPSARHRVTICTGRTCARRGGARLVKLARSTLGIPLFTSTEDEAIHIEPFRCFGECAMAPNVRIDGGTRGAMTESRFRLLLGVLVRR
jgi:NADH:ubiquinone oxidoreductase subunit E